MEISRQITKHNYLVTQARFPFIPLPGGCATPAASLGPRGRGLRCWGGWRLGFKAKAKMCAGELAAGTL